MHSLSLINFNFGGLKIPIGYIGLKI